jgi:hypothetical protein
MKRHEPKPLTMDLHSDAWLWLTRTNTGVGLIVTVITAIGIVFTAYHNLSARIAVAESTIIEKSASTNQRLDRIQNTLDDIVRMMMRSP